MKNETLDSMDKWILDVRKQVTEAFPNITVAEIFRIFTASSEEMDTLFEAYHSEKTPAEAFQMIKKQIRA